MRPVSRETSDRLEHLATLVEKWNPRINLVSRSTLVDLRTRHIEDSRQVHDLADHPVSHWVDLGTGGGFPGLVVAILAADTGSPAHVTLIESDQRKVVFLKTVLRETGVSAQVQADRIEKTPPLAADVLSARALADLPALLAMAARHLAPGGTCLFPKGASWQKELAQAQEQWSFRHEAITSRTDSSAVILKIKDINRV